ncbi:MAG: ribose-phosphate pyrophosphokinase [Alphaproteobacteria bacterium]|nr:ribose-phosphate pyrophosphokinase [Alphaproteobacteria bacterium]MBO7537242.1 ribose-phosphate pyrophosphokinase [Alphaproteobacteria bacterium]
MEIIYIRNSEKLAKSIAEKLNLSASPALVKKFSNDEMLVSLHKDFSHVTVVANTRTNEDWFELFLLLDALKNTRIVNLCLTYSGYSRQDKINPNESCGNMLFFKFLETFNIEKFIFLDNHNEPILRSPFQHLSALSLFIQDIKNKYKPEDIVIVSPDLGRAKDAQFVAETLKTDLAVCVKSRNVFNKVNKMKVLGNVENKICVLIDDMIDSGATLCHASDALLEVKAYKVVAYATHGVFSQGALQSLASSNIAKIVVTDSICCRDNLSDKFEKLSVARLLADAIRILI